MRRLWDGLDPGTYTTTKEKDNADSASRDSDEPSSADRDSAQDRSAKDEEEKNDSANGKKQRASDKAVNPSTLLGLPKDANAGEVILVNKRDIMVLQFVVVRLVEKGILDAEEVMRMKRDANEQIRESHPDITAEE